MEKRFVFFATVLTGIQVFAHQRHESCGVFFVHFSFHVLIKFFIEFIAGNFLRVRRFEHTQKPQNRLGGELFGWVDFLSDFLDKRSKIHTQIGRLKKH